MTATTFMLNMGLAHAGQFANATTAMISLIAVVATGCLGCTRELEQEELRGRYSVTLDDSRQVIELNPGSTYTNIFYRDGEVLWRESSNWTYGFNKYGGGDAFIFHDFRLGFESYANSQGIWLVRPSFTLLGEARLCFDLDLPGRCFMREQELGGPQ